MAIDSHGKHEISLPQGHPTSEIEYGFILRDPAHPQGMGEYLRYFKYVSFIHAITWNKR